MHISIERLNQVPVSEQKIEIVERKGVGHPDSLADGICECASRALSKYYAEEKGFICHHNVDKGLLVGGVSNPVFGGGRVIEPPDAIVAGTATILQSIDDIRMLIFEEVEKYFEEHLRFTNLLNPEIRVKVHPGSVDLVDVYNRISKGEMPLANDTSFGVGFAPLTILEELVYLTERLLNSKKIKKKYPFIGEDIKVMGIREERKLKLTVAVAFVSRFVDSLEQYYEYKEKIKELINKKFGSNIEVSVNTADHKDSIYLTVTGCSWENGDDGQVGRGNRANGLITPCRSMSLEAIAGKNSVSHVGKIYNLKAEEIAKNISERFNVKEVNVMLVSQIGKPINDPFVGIKYIPNEEIKVREVEEIVSESLSWRGFEELKEVLLNGKLSVF